MSTLVDFVSCLQGTDSDEDFSRGNTLPLIARPFSFTAWTPQTREGRWAFSWRDAKIQGFRATHQPSPWMGDFGQFTIMPQTGLCLATAARRSSTYDRPNLVVKPHYCRVYLVRYDCLVELVPTERCAIFRFSFYNTGTARLIFDIFSQGEIEFDAARREAVGIARANHGGVMGDFGCRFVALLNRSWTNHTPPSADATGCMEFPVEKGCTVELRIATSWVSTDQARLTLMDELKERSFEEIRGEAQEAWEQRLGKVELETDDQEIKKTFYSCLYRTFLFPQKMHEKGPDGGLIHYSPYTGKVHDGRLYTNNGFWDTHRTVYPLFSLLCPKDYSEILQGWLQAQRESGWFPRWPSPGLRDCMIGTHIDAVFLDAAAKGIGDLDWKEAYAGLRRHAFEPAPVGAGYGRPGLLEYIEKGYVPSDKFPHATSCTLDYAYGDFCLAQLALLLGYREDAASLQARSLNYRHVFDESVGFMRGRNLDGSWRDPFSQVEWGGPFIEGSAWQCSWSVPHDPTGLIDLHGGRKSFTAKLDQMFGLPPSFEAGHYDQEIHEMSEMAAAPYGQYAHSNQPVHHVLYLYAAAGAPEKTRYWVRKIMREYYGPGPGGLPGDEDNGEMSAWYILSALGLFPSCPGVPKYCLGAPLVPLARIHLDTGATLTIRCEDNPNGNALESDKVTWQGDRWDDVSIDHALLIGGGELHFRIGATG